jgi:hypothetical protein
MDHGATTMAAASGGRPVASREEVTMTHRLIAGLALAASLLAPAAQARVMRVTYLGLVESGFDTTGVFGAPGSSLGGQAFRAVVTLNDKKGVSEFDLPHESYITRGGPLLLTIAGHTVNFYGDRWNFTDQFANLDEFVLPESIAPLHTWGIINIRENDDLSQLRASECFNLSQSVLYVESTTNAFLTTGDYHEVFSL